MGLASALSTALTGLSASETMISVAGNNISNSATDGFKQSQALFTTQFLQTLSLGSAPSGSGAGANGGTNPQQIGLGTQVAEITPDFSQGTIQVSSSPSDLAIQGDGFFIVQGAGTQEYTRDGSFTLNSGSQLVTSTGQTLLGYGVDKNFNIDKTTLQPLTIPLGSTAVAQATQNVTLQGDLSPTETVASTPQIIQSQVLSDASIESPPSPSAISLTALAPPSTTTTALAPDTGAGNVAAGTYTYEITFANAAGQEGPPSGVVGPITTTGTPGTDQAVDLTNLPTIPSGFSQINIYRADAAGGGTYQLAGSTTGSTFTDTKSDAQLGATLNGSTLAPGNYSYYVSYYNSVTGEESRPTPLIGPQSISLDGRKIELSNLPTPSAASGFDQVRIYRNTSTDSSNFFLDATVSAGTSSYIDGASDASISSNAQVNLNGPPISAGTKLTDLVELNGSTYEQPFANATQISFTGTKGGNTLTTKTLNVTSTTTVQDLIDFVDQASGIQPPSARILRRTPFPEILAAASTRRPARFRFTSNNGQPNAVRYRPVGVHRDQYGRHHGPRKPEFQYDAKGRRHRPFHNRLCGLRFARRSNQRAFDHGPGKHEQCGYDLPLVCRFRRQPAPNRRRYRCRNRRSDVQRSGRSGGRDERHGGDRPLAVCGSSVAVQARLFASIRPGAIIGQHPVGCPARRLGRRNLVQL